MQVFAGIDELSGKDIAIKCVRKDRVVRWLVDQERETMQTLSRNPHRGIGLFLGFCEPGSSELKIAPGSGPTDELKVKM